MPCKSAQVESNARKRRKMKYKMRDINIADN